MAVEMAAATEDPWRVPAKKRPYLETTERLDDDDDDNDGGGATAAANDDSHGNIAPTKRVRPQARWQPDILYDNLGIPYCQDTDVLLFPPSRRLYVYGRQLEPWWFKVRANVPEPERQTACRLTGNSVAAACGLDEYKLAADLGRELSHAVDARVPLGSERTQRSLEYGHLHQERARMLLSRLVFDNRVPMYEIGFVVDSNDELLGTSPDYLLMPFDSPLPELKSDGRGVVVEVKCSARSLLDRPHPSYICQMHQEMALCGWTTFGLLVIYHQDAIRVLRVDFDIRLWTWIRLRAALFMYVLQLFGHTNMVHTLLSQCRLLRHVAHDTREWWFPPPPSSRRRPLTPEQLGVGRTHALDTLGRVEQQFLDKHHPGWRGSLDFRRHCLSILPPVKPTVKLIYEHVTPTPAELLKASGDTETRDRHGLVKRKLWRHDQPIDWSSFAKYPNAERLVATGSEETIERRHCLLNASLYSASSHSPSSSSCM